MPYLDPEKQKEAKRRYYASKGRMRQAERYRESRWQAMTINPHPLIKALANWR